VKPPIGPTDWFKRPARSSVRSTQRTRSRPRQRRGDPNVLPLPMKSKIVRGKRITIEGELPAVTLAQVRAQLREEIDTYLDSTAEYPGWIVRDDYAKYTIACFEEALRLLSRRTNTVPSPKANFRRPMRRAER